MTDRNELERLLAAATEAPWAVDGPPNNQIIWSGPESRVAFMAHSDGCDVERDEALSFVSSKTVNELLAVKRGLVERVREFWR